MDIGELIHELRTAHGWPQTRLTDETNTRHATTLTREYVARWERGKKATPREFYLAALSSVAWAALGLDPPGFTPRRYQRRMRTWGRTLGTGPERPALTSFPKK
ncbi:helix-turn-helix domain-containing protein [Streptomyces lavendulae]|uniref:helix-turn-helix domain-containing protein n=1 Tax=Streptomyces lavendulae TaxID=1914 RepID=UPI0024A1B530|nr:helix-turn-helix domain-containing protein [Streptomyces lavendulae]GLW04186.1 hypothetical protein Slala05_78160 [Streptomyces lavendulae subsp. lavendulae]